MRESARELRKRGREGEKKGTEIREASNKRKKEWISFLVKKNFGFFFLFEIARKKEVLQIKAWALGHQSGWTRKF